MNAISLAGQVALVTGAGHGIGRASALALAEAGAYVVAADRNAEGAIQTQKLIDAADHAGEAVTVDVTDAEGLRSVVAEIVDTCGRLDIVHANAGVLIAGTALTHSLEEWDRTYEVNVRGTLLTVRAALPQLIRQGGGTIIITASISGMIGEPNIAAYNSSKGALINLTRQLAIEYAHDGVRVNCICPGWIETGFNDPVLGHLDPDELGRLIEQQVPWGRQGTPDDIAPSVVFLASDWARYITGQSLVIDGGLTAM